MKSLQTFNKRRIPENEKKEEKEFIARNGDLRRSPVAHQGGRQFFDSADWSMFKDDIRKELKISSLPHKTTINHEPKSPSRKSIFASDSARGFSSNRRTKKTISNPETADH